MIPGRDPIEEEAILLDVYLDELLAGTATRPSPVDAEDERRVDDQLATAARAVGVALARFHPSFRFEERLAARLRAVAAGMEPGPEATGTGVVIPFAPPAPAHRGRSRRVNGALIGGAISAGVSLASIAAGAIVARRRSRAEGRWERMA